MVRRRKQYFTLDRGVYWALAGGASVWLADSPSIGSSCYAYAAIAAIMRLAGTKEIPKMVVKILVDPSIYVHVQQNRRMEGTGGVILDDNRGACVFHTAVHKLGNLSYLSGRPDPGQNMAALIGGICCTYTISAANFNLATRT